MMLINIVIIFLKDLLPIFILLCLLKANAINTYISKRVIILLSVISIFGISATFTLLPLISDLWDGAGIEVSQTIGIIVVYFCLLFSYSNTLIKPYLSARKRYFSYFALVVFIIIQTSVFIVLIEGYLLNLESFKNIIAGLSIGIGICLSFSFLLFFLLVWLNKNKYYLVTYSFWALFLTGQVSQIVNLLQQVDIIQSSKALWDSTNFIEDKSEYGHLFNALFGYEARPSVEFVLLYLSSLVVVYSYCFIGRCHKNNELKGNEFKAGIKGIDDEF